MFQQAISTELVRRVRHQAPSKTTDYRDERVPGFVLRARPSGVHSWRVQLPDRRWLTLGRVDEIALSDAREAAQQRRAKAALGEAIPTRRPTSEATLRTFLADTYEPWMKATYGKRCDQVAMIRAAFRDLLDQKLSDLSTARIDRWRAQRRSHHPSQATKTKAREVSRATINHNVSGLRAAMARAVEWGALSVMPLGKIKRKKEDENAIVRYLSADEEARLRSALFSRDKARSAGRDSANKWRRERGYEEWPAYGTYTDHLTPLVLVAVNTGLRRGELFQVCWRDVDLQRRILTVRGEGAKTGQTRHVPLNSEAVRVLKIWKPGPVCEAGWCVFGGSDSSTPTVEIKKAWAGVLKAAKVNGFRFHDLRHTFASKLVMASVDLNTVRELLGHKSIAMTLRYAHLAPEHKAAAVESLVKRRSRRQEAA
jgi:integrase